MPVRFWNPGKQYTEHKEELDNAMHDVLSRGALILRPEVEEFEKKFAEYVGTKYAVALASGTDALMLSLITEAGTVVGKNEVIVPSYTFRATVEAIEHAGCVPVLADIGEDWRKYKTIHTLAIIPCHLEGKVMDWTPDDDIVMIEDACQAVGAAPIRGLAACYSFYPAKILGCFGDGGAVATDSLELYQELRKMRNHYKDAWEEGYGYNSRLDNLQAAILLVKIKYLKQAVTRRQEIARKYDSALVDLVEVPVMREVYQDYVIETGFAKKLHYFLQERGIETMLNHYPFPGDLSKGPRTLSYEENSLRLPIDPILEDTEIDEVIEGIESFFAQHAKG